MQKLLEELYTSYNKDVFNYLYSLSRNVDISEELTAEVFYKIVKSLANFRGESDIKTWMFSIARHEWIDYLKKKNRQIQTEILSDIIEINESKNVDDIYAKELIERIHQILDNENERSKNVVLMRLEGYSFYEIGLKYNISESSARVIDFRAKSKIRNILKKEGFINE